SREGVKRTNPHARVPVRFGAGESQPLAIWGERGQSAVRKHYFLRGRDEKANRALADRGLFDLSEIQHGKHKSEEGRESSDQPRRALMAQAVGSRLQTG